jgi:hypothetical protein
MSVADRPSYTKTLFQIPQPSENVLLAVIAAAFLVLHIAAGFILIKSSAVAISTNQEEAKPSPYYD